MSQLQVTGEAKIRDLQGPVVSNSGVISALDGDASQYVRGDGTLADFPTSTGGGSSVSYYLNSSVSQGTIGGVAYRQLGKTPIIGAGTDITISANGYVASYITDANDPALLEVPAGNFNCEFYFSVNSNNHNPFVYAEVYKYDGTTFSLIGTSVGVPEYLSNGTTLSPYYFAIPVSQTVLTITDRIAIRIYVNVDGRTVTLHTENNHLCQVVTTFSKGLISLNNLTRQNQFFGTGTDGTDFNISSVTATHTFNLPVASATNTGKLSSTDWSTFNGKVPYTGATNSVDLGAFSLSGDTISGVGIFSVGSGTQSGYIGIKQGTTFLGNISGYNSINANGTKYILISDVGTTNYKSASFELGSLTNNTERTFTLPDLSGTLALLEGGQTFSGTKTFNISPISEGGYSFKILPSGTIFQNGYSVLSSVTGSVSITQAISAGNLKVFTFDFSSWATNTSRTYNLPDASGTIAILEAGTQTFTGTVNVLGSLGTKFGISIEKGNTPSPLSLNDIFIYASSGATNIINFANSSYRTSFSFPTSTNTYTFPAATGTLALTSDIPSITGLVPYTGATANVNLGIYSLTSTGLVVIKNGSSVSGIVFEQGAGIGVGGAGFSTIGPIGSARFGFFFGGSTQSFVFNATPITTQRAYTMPDADGTIALTSNLSGYLPLTGGTLTGALSGTSATFSSTLGVTGASTFNADVTLSSTGTAFILLNNTTPTTGKQWRVSSSSSGNFFITQPGVADVLTIAHTTGAATFSSSVTAQTGEFISGGQEGSVGSVVRISSTNGLARNWGIVNTWDNYGDLTFRVSNAAGGNALTAGATRMVILANGNVGIGTSAPSDKLTIVGGNILVDQSSFGTAQLRVKGTGTTTGFDIQNSNNDGYLWNRDSGNIYFATGNTERMRITSGGQVLIAGTYNPYSSANRGNITLNGSTDNIIAFTNNSTPRGYIFHTGTDLEILNATSTGVIRLYTNATERMRITSGGNLLVGTTTSVANYAMDIGGNLTGGVWSKCNNSGDAQFISSSTTIGFHYYALTTGAVFYVLTNGDVRNANNSYGAISDIKLKENITDASPKLDDLLKVKIRNYNLIDDETKTKQIGVIAQELEEIFPNMITEDKLIDSDETIKTVKYSVFVPMLIKAMQEQNQLIKDLESRIKNLENK